MKEIYCVKNKMRSVPLFCQIINPPSHNVFVIGCGVNGTLFAVPLTVRVYVRPRTIVALPDTVTLPVPVLLQLAMSVFPCHSSRVASIDCPEKVIFAEQ